ncbi:hypothetical protein B0183_01175 [Glaesserella parasuis]|uniref:hypothetical protein n=1 Tax=Glaesserella parasuis TaxID=738 RepID=UPI0009D5B8DC|nr:hypothetical protein [Glaesserella parasuis]OOR93959.1 hypothetical protein B0183_01175 [Glaesserella parasuis]STO80149.1 Uncharacterised protein [Glaesserella parasuis]
MKKLLALTLSVFALVACGDEKPTRETVVAELKSTGVEINDVRTLERDTKSPLPNSYAVRFAFSTPEIAPKGGQVFICDEKKLCDPLYVYFDALKAFGGSYYYQSPKGLVVLQLNEKMTPETAKKLEKALAKF